MPELPEIETSRRGLAPLLTRQTVAAVAVREPRLRWPVPARLSEALPGQRVERIERRAKYLVLRADRGAVIMHLGMSGSLRVVPAETAPQKHDHLDLIFVNGSCLRLRDPRRFGAVLWTEGDPLSHPLLAHLGPEPLDDTFSGDWLYATSRRRRAAVKSFVMDGRVVVGVGNIYASESLYLAGIHPGRAAGRISRARYQRLADCIKQVLENAIAAGGTTLRDFVDSSGEPGYFGQRLRVYGRGDEPCEACGEPIAQRVIGQRSSFYCKGCQR